MCDNRLRALYLKELITEVRAMLGEWWRQRGSTAAIPGFQSSLDTPTGETGGVAGAGHSHRARLDPADFRPPRDQF